MDISPDYLLEQIATAIKRGKVDVHSPYPADLKGEPGASELTETALRQGISPQDILSLGLVTGMNAIGERFERGEAFIPELLIAAKAMKAAMVHLKPCFDSGSIQYRGMVILGTVSGDLHDIGKNIVRMVLEGEGWQVVDLGVDVKPEIFLEKLREFPDGVIGLSALLTTTMINMESITQRIKSAFPHTPVFLGGAPLSEAYSSSIGADGYFPDPQKFARFLNENHDRIA